MNNNNTNNYFNIPPCDFVRVGIKRLKMKNNNDNIVIIIIIIIILQQIQIEPNNTAMQLEVLTLHRKRTIMRKRYLIFGNKLKFKKK